MQYVVQEAHLRRLAGSATLGLAVSASGMSLVSAWLVPLGLWPSLAWAVVGCVSALWALQIVNRGERPIRDVIAGVDAELPGARPAPGRRLDRR